MVLQALAWDGSKGLPPVLLQAVEQKGAAFVVFGGQPGKPSAPVGATSVVHDHMPVICDSDAYDQWLASSERQVANRDRLKTSSELLHKPQTLAPSVPGDASGMYLSNAAKLVSA